MNARYTQTRQVFIFTLLVSILLMALLPANVITAEAKGSPRALTGFVKVSPANGVTNLATSVTLKWNAAPANPYGFTKYYKYCYYTTGGTCSFNGVLSSTQINIAGLATQTTYFWQIQVVYCKDGGCVQKEKHEANDGVVWSFKTGGTAAPGAFTKLSPANGAINITNKTLSWAASQGVTSYQYCYTPNLNDNNCLYLNGWINVGNVTSYTIPNNPKFIWGKSYYWQIRASNGGGTRLADNGVWWSFTTAQLVGQTTLISPTGAITESTPTFRWNHLAGITWYYLWVNGASGNVFKQWYAANTVCSGGTCEATPSLTLPAGNFTWWIQTYNPTGHGPWSTGLSFSTPVPTPPGAATLISPNGNIADNYTPTYTWNEAPARSETDEKSKATWYYLVVKNAVGTVLQQWYPASSICSGGICAVNTGITLGGGTHTWQVHSWNSAGYGPVSATMTFSTYTAPDAVTLISPNGVSANPPTYRWNRVARATWYYLWVNDPSGNIFKSWYEASAVCNATTCTVTAPASLPSGSYSWWVRSWNKAGYAPWSPRMDFSIP